MLSMVLLPQPEGPSRPTSWPSGISKVKSFTATTSLLSFLSRLGKVFVKFFRVTFMGDPSFADMLGLFYNRIPVMAMLDF